MRVCERGGEQIARGVGAMTDAPEGADGHSHPEALGMGRIDHLDLFPMPATARTGFEERFNPDSPGLPVGGCGTGGQVGHDQPGLGRALVPDDHQGAEPLASGGGKTGNGVRPTLAHTRTRPVRGQKGLPTGATLPPLLMRVKGCQRGRLTATFNQRA